MNQPKDQPPTRCLLHELNLTTSHVKIILTCWTHTHAHTQVHTPTHTHSLTHKPTCLNRTWNLNWGPFQKINLARRAHANMKLTHVNKSPYKIYLIPSTSRSVAGDRASPKGGSFWNWSIRGFSLYNYFVKCLTIFAWAMVSWIMHIVIISPHRKWIL